LRYLESKREASLTHGRAGLEEDDIIVSWLPLWWGRPGAMSK
jgi:hypothetical protein